MSVAIEELVVADPPEAWREAGFGVDDGVCVVGPVRLRLVGREAGEGIVDWTLAEPTDETVRGERHPNGVTGVDHVVLLAPDVDRALTDLAARGLEPRREREGELGGIAVRQVFYRLGEVILEVVGDPTSRGEGPAEPWGITFTVGDIDAAAAYFGDRAGPVKDAVQPGRRITTLRTRELGISTRVALISPHVRTS